MCCRCGNCHGCGRRNHEYDWSWYYDAEQDYYSYYYHPSTPKESPSGKDSEHTLPTLMRTSDGQSRRCSPARNVEPSVMTKAYSPVFSVRYNSLFNEHSRKYETHVTRSLHSAYSNCGHDQVALSIKCAMKTAQIVKAFSRSIDTCDWQLTVQIPKEAKVWKSKMITRKYQLWDGYLLKPVLERGICWVPALEEKYLPRTRTIFCNSGWVTDNYNSMPQKLLLALPHYSFKWSGRKYMIGSLRASIDHKAQRITITTPTLMSREGKLYGCEDIGIKGIRNYFYWNRSSSFVQDFEKPRCTQFYYQRKPQNMA